MKVELNLEYVFSALVEIGVTEPAKAAKFIAYSVDNDLESLDSIRSKIARLEGGSEWEGELLKELQKFE